MQLIIFLVTNGPSLVHTFIVTIKEDKKRREEEKRLEEEEEKRIKEEVLILFVYFLLYINHFLQPWGRHTSAKRQKKKEIFPFMPLSCGFGHRTDFHLSRASYSCATHNFGISSKSRVHPLVDDPAHSPCFPDIQTSFL